ANIIALRMASDRRIWWRFHLYSIPMMIPTKSASTDTLSALYNWSISTSSIRTISPLIS
ncbi:hypothetical protein ACR2U3_27440, partial [Klebsiella pneumoniae]